MLFPFYKAGLMKLKTTCCTSTVTVSCLCSSEWTAWGQLVQNCGTVLSWNSMLCRRIPLSQIMKTVICKIIKKTNNCNSVWKKSICNIKRTHSNLVTDLHYNTILSSKIAIRRLYQIPMVT